MNEFELIVRIYEATLWPATLLIIIYWFKGEFNEFLGRLKKFEVSSEGLSLEAFEEKVRATKSFFNQIPKSKNPLSDKSIVDNFSWNINASNYEQLKEWNNVLESQIRKKAGNDKPSTLETLKQLNVEGIISNLQYESNKHLLELAQQAPKEISKSLLEDLRKYYIDAYIL